MPKTSKAVVMRYYQEVCNEGQIASLDELCAEDYVNHNPGPGMPPTRDGDKMMIAMYRAMFPDMRVTVEDMICEGDKVVTRWVGKATHRGEMPGIPPTGREVTISGIDISRVVNGRIQEAWHQEDQFSLMQQIGMLAAFSPDASAGR